MKAFIIFPVICIFIITLTIVRIKDLPWSWRKRILISLAVSVLFAILLISTINYLFAFVYYCNLGCVLLMIPSISYLANKYFNHLLPTHPIVKIILLSAISAIITLLIFAISIFISILFNPVLYI
jgi:hypothetical protein